MPSIHHCSSSPNTTRRRFRRRSAAISLTLIAGGMFAPTANAADGDLIWARQFGGTGIDVGNALAVDDAGNVYIAGLFTGTADLDPGAGTFSKTSAGSSDIFVTKLDVAGNFLWAAVAGAAINDEAYGVAVTPDGGVVVTGEFLNTVDFDPGAGTSNLTSAGSLDTFVWRLSADGNLVWARNFGGTGVDFANAVAVDALGNVYTTGQFAGSADFDPGAGTANLSAVANSDIFLSKLDSNGNFVWARAAGGTGSEDGKELSFDDAGNVYVTGQFSLTADFDPTGGTSNLTAVGGTDTFVWKLDTAGLLVWARGFGGAGFETGFGVAVDPAGNVYTSGNFQQTVDFDPGAGTFNLAASTGQNVYVSKLDAAGNFVWAREFDGGAASTANRAGIAVDAAGNVYASGEFGGTTDFDTLNAGGSMTAAGSQDVFVVKLDTAGAFVWAKQLGGTGDDKGRSIAVDAASNVFTTGEFEATGDFDPGAGTTSFTSAGSEDVFVSKLIGPYEYVSVVPARLMDTRPGATTIDSQFEGIGVRSAGSTTELQVTGRAGVATDTVAVALNITVVGATGGGFVTVFPCGAAQPNASNLNFVAGDTIPNLVITQLGTNGKVCIFTSATTHLIADLDGFYPVGSVYAPLVPSRLMDSRVPASPTVDGLFEAIGIRAAGTTTELQITGRATVPADAAAVVLNVTATAAAGLGFVTVYPCGAPQPNASNLNFVAGDTIPNLVITPVGAGGKVCLFTSADTHLIVDIDGYYPATSNYAPLVPGRLLDSRVPSSPTVDGAFQGIGLRTAGSTLELQVTGRHGVPADADTAVLNVTVTAPTGGGFVTVFPCGASQPNASNLNFAAGDTIPNLVISRIGVGGKICIFTSAATHLIADVNGYQI